MSSLEKISDFRSTVTSLMVSIPSAQSQRFKERSKLANHSSLSERSCAGNCLKVANRMAVATPARAGVGKESPSERAISLALGFTQSGLKEKSNDTALLSTAPSKPNDTALATLSATVGSSTPMRGGGTIKADVTGGNHLRDVSSEPDLINKRIKSSSALLIPACSCFLDNMEIKSAASIREAATPCLSLENKTWILLPCGSLSSSFDPAFDPVVCISGRNPCQ
mmetsp:Transcript_19278/g.32035  ORF Transcript_19278/g.32035 Transcript_19278/m.32035 type:complete len:224 (-) Transcript_19278:270-941(-)